MKIKAIVTDLDGTLLNDGSKIDEDTVKWLLEFQMGGGIVILASGRHLKGCVSIAEKVLRLGTGFIVSANGVYVYDVVKNELWRSSLLGRKDFKKINSICPNAMMTVVTNGMDYIVNPRSILLELIKNVLSNLRNRGQKRKFLKSSEIEKLEGKIEKIIVKGEYNRNGVESLKEDYNIIRESNNIIEVQDCSAEKLNAVCWLLDYLDIKMEEILVFGNDGNDLRMLSYFRNSVAMGNAEEQVKGVSRIITATNNQAGVLKVLKEYQTRKLFY